MRLARCAASFLAAIWILGCGGGPAAPSPLPVTTPVPALAPVGPTRAPATSTSTPATGPTRLRLTPTPTSENTPTPTSTPVPTSSPTPTTIPHSPGPTLDPAELLAKGKRLVERQNCLTCHTIDGHSFIGPTFQGLFESVRELEGGGTAIADADYLWESIKRPNAKIVLGYFPDAMPTVFFNDAEIDAMAEYIKSLR